MSAPKEDKDKDNKDNNIKEKKETDKDNKIISGHNEIILNRGADLNDVAEQLDGFFDYPLVVINNEVLDRLDKLKLDRTNIKLVEKVEGKSQWLFSAKTPENPDDCPCDDCLTKYTVFSSEASDFMSDPKLEECMSDEILNNSSDSSSESDSSDSSSDSSDSSKDDKKSDDKNSKSEFIEGITGTNHSSSSESSSDSSSETSGISEILTDGWSNSRSSESLAGSLGKRPMNTRVPPTLDTTVGPDTRYIPQMF